MKLKIKIVGESIVLKVTELDQGFSSKNLDEKREYVFKYNKVLGLGPLRNLDGNINYGNLQEFVRDCLIKKYGLSADITVVWILDSHDLNFDNFDILIVQQEHSNDTLDDKPTKEEILEALYNKGYVPLLSNVSDLPECNQSVEYVEELGGGPLKNIIGKINYKNIELFKFNFFTKVFGFNKNNRLIDLERLYQDNCDLLNYGALPYPSYPSGLGIIKIIIPFKTLKYYNFPFEKLRGAQFAAHVFCGNAGLEFIKEEEMGRVLGDAIMDNYSFGYESAICFHGKDDVVLIKTFTNKADSLTKSLFEKVLGRKWNNNEHIILYKESIRCGISQFEKITNLDGQELYKLQIPNENIRVKWYDFKEKKWEADSFKMSH